MPCRVGISTDLKSRKNFWNNQVVGLKNWRILQEFNNKEDAQAYETSYAKKYDCHAHQGGPDAPGIWYVYRFDYVRMKPKESP